MSNIQIFDTYMNKTDGTIGTVEIISSRYVYLSGSKGEDLGAHTPAALRAYWKLCATCPVCNLPYPEDEGVTVELAGHATTICKACHDDGPGEPVTRAAAPREV